jgi:hypothetical protein
MAHLRRRPRPLSDFDGARASLEAQLRARAGSAHFGGASSSDGAACVVDDEMCVAARLYTGPMFTKYNLVLRAASGKMAWLQHAFDERCKGNKYATTLHAINHTIRILSSLSKCEMVYRGVA